MATGPTIGLNLRRLRRLAHLTQEQLAERAGLQPDIVRKLEQGQRDSARIGTLRRLADALRTDIADLVTEPSERSLQVTASEHSPPQELRVTTEKLVVLDSEYGGDDVVRLAVRAWKRGASQLTKGDWSGPTEREMLAALGDLAQVASWTAYDAEHLELARTMAMESVHASRLAGDRTTTLFALDGLAMQAVRSERAGEAYRLADEVAAAGRVSGRTLAITHIRRGGADSIAGRRERALAELGHARTLLLDGISSSDPAWTWWIDESEVAWHEGMALLRLDDPAAAVERFREARATSAGAGHRSRWGTLVHLLDAEVSAGDWSAAEQHIEEVMAEVGGYSSTRVTTVLRRAARGIIEANGPSSTATDAAGVLLADGSTAAGLRQGP